jgi:hypothetical protein
MRHLMTLLTAAGAAGCQAFDAPPPPPPPQIVNLRVHSDPSTPVPGAGLFFNGTKIATTDEAGLGQLKLAGRDGDAFDITVLCPQGYLSPEKPIQVTLKRLADPTKSPEYAATCPPTVRTIVVAVRADNGPRLPVTYLGEEVARTDESGAAHVLLKLQPGARFDLTLSTDDKQHALLRPQNPTQSFAVRQRDDVFTFDQKFEQNAKRPAVRRKPRPKGPVKISSDRRP